MKVSVIGTGYVGLVSGTCFAEMGNHVICVDNNPDKLKKLQNAELTIYEPGLDILFYRNIAKKRLEFTDNLKEAVHETDIVFLCLPTPQGGDGAADLSAVMKVADLIGGILKEMGDSEYRIIVNKSTVPVGTSKKVHHEIAKHGVSNFDVVSNPEFLREGFAVEDFMKPDRIVMGSRSDKASEKMKFLYDPFVRQGNPILVMDNESAEVTKYAANSYLAMRITYMNELANFCEAVGADIDVVRKGMGTDTRIGKRFLFAGIGYGGSCFPKDVNALIKTAKDANSELKILTVVDEVNDQQKSRLVIKIDEHFKGDIKGKKFAIWGLSFKPNTDDMREAPSIKVVNKLLEMGAKISAYDPAAMENSKYFFGDKIEYVEDQYDAVPDADALIVLTEWNEFRNPDFGQLKGMLKSPVIFDGRNVYSVSKMKELGYHYYSIGRQKV
ncbi:MAG: UDP-glucose 6-dehydrogenase [Melioribacteraceae bacterium]|nr:MAG: UDP-glucose 6-dehydrogenase [Melioribacteraceae bacterium]